MLRSRPITHEERLAPNVLYGCGGSVILMLAPQLTRVPVWESAILILALLWKLYSVWRRTVPPRLLLTALALILAGGVFVSFGTFIGRTAGTALLVSMLVMKYVETHTARDATVVIFLSYFVVVTNFLFDQSIVMAAYLVVSVLACTLTLITLHTRAPTPSLMSRSRLSLRLLLEALPIALLLFVLFPRIPGPLWGIPEDRHSATTGLSDTMSPGTISNLSRSARVAFRVRFEGPPPRHAELYWRGPVLWDYDGTTWTQGQPAAARPTRLSVHSEPVRYALTMQPHGKRWVFALDAPGSVPRDTRLTHDLQLLATKSLVSVRRFDLTSFTSYRTVSPLDPRVHKAALDLPEGRNPRTVELGRELAAAHRDPAAIARAGLDFFRSQPFVYTLSPPLLGADAMDDFLFGTRRGFCEFFASAYVVMMRAARVPARVVTGYMGGEMNAIDDYMLVRQSDAHAWAEVWLPGRGWVRVDPTATVAPERIEAGIESALGDSAELPFVIRPSFPLIRSAALLWDSLNNRWNDWVLGYGPTLQRELFGNFGLGKYTAAKAGIAMVSLIGAVLIVFAFLPRLKAEARDPVLRYYLRFCRKLARAGLPRAPREGPLDYAARAASAFPEQRAQIDTITRLFVQLFYAGRRDPRWRAQLALATRQLKIRRAAAQELAGR